MRMTMGIRRESTSESETELEQKRRELREARLKAARNQPNWSEITPAERLCPRGPERFGWLCDAADDRLYTVARGAAFEPGRASVFATHTPVTFYVDREGDVIPLEPASPKTWSDVVRQRPDLVQVPAT